MSYDSVAHVFFTGQRGCSGFCFNQGGRSTVVFAVKDDCNICQHPQCARVTADKVIDCNGWDAANRFCYFANAATPLMYGYEEAAKKAGSR